MLCGQILEEISGDQSCANIPKWESATAWPQ